MKKFAAFDVDGTILRNALFFQVVDDLIKNKYLPPDLRGKLDAKFEAYKARQHAEAFNEYAQESVRALFGNMKNLKTADYRAAVDRVVSLTKDYTYVYTRDLIKSLKDQGYFLIAISGSEMYAVDQFTAHYDFDVCIGEMYHEKDGYLTGEVLSVIHDKDIFLKDFVAKHDLTYEGSVAIGDSKSDAKMLELVERPIAFNPEQGLFEIARSRGWKIIVERKNVIYELDKHDSGYLLA